MNRYTRIASLILAVVLVAAMLGGCSDDSVKLDPKNPVTITIWHYYNGSIMNAFEYLINEFNETVGLEKGIIVESYGLGNIGELEKAVMSSANKEVGSMEMPDIFASYADTAYEAEKLGLLADLDKYFTQEEQAEYITSYIEEGKIGLNGELRIFPVAKSTEIFMLNDTDWQPFAQANNLTYDDLSTLESLAGVAKLYYEWTDAQTPDVLNDGKAFYGRDSMANFFIITSKSFGVEIFDVQNGEATIRVDEEIMRRIWDYYYVPYISGYYYSYGKFRSDDAKVGDILAYVGSTTSTTYFPSEVTAGGEVYPVDAMILPVPNFEGADRVLVQQGAGMVVTKSTEMEEYASVEFLKWFTEATKNTEFAALSGYTPVKKDAVDYDMLKSVLAANDKTLDPITDETLRIALGEMQTSAMYTNKAFSGGAAARSVLDYNLADKAKADREAVLLLLADGASLEDAVAQFNTDEAFDAWVADLTANLESAG